METKSGASANYATGACIKFIVIDKIPQRRVVFIYRQEIFKDISLFISQPKAKFYDELFIDLDLSCIPVHNSKTGRTGCSNHAMICAFIVMNCEEVSQISDLHDYLSNNLLLWMLLPLKLMFLTTILSPLKRISFLKPHLQRLIRIAGLVFKPLQISMTKRSMNYIGATTIIFLSTVLFRMITGFLLTEAQ